jgi:excisionase family DNA binding protein
MEDMKPRAAVLRDALDDGKSAAASSSAMLTVDEACQYLRISKWTLYRLIQGNKVKTIKIGSRRLIRRQSVLDFVEQLEQEAGA